MIDNTVEYIMCAATWHKGFPTAHCLPVNITEGVVISGCNHAQILHIVLSLTGKRQCETQPYEQGFLTSTNRFIGRVEALAIAKSQNQLNSYYQGQPQLYSEFIITYPSK